MKSLIAREKEVTLEFQDGDVIFKEGDASRDMFIIQEGTVRVSRLIDGRDFTLMTIYKGDFFGEMSLMEDLPRNATITSVGRSKLLSLKPGSLLLRIRQDPTFAFEMIQKLCARFRKIDYAMTFAVKDKGITQDDLNGLFLEAEYGTENSDKNK